MRDLITKANPNMTTNQKMLMEDMLKKMYSLFDSDKNGILDL